MHSDRIPPAYSAPSERSRLQYAAILAAKFYPGPVGEMLARELNTWEDFGWRFGGTALIQRLVNYLHDKEKTSHGG